MIRKVDREIDEEGYVYLLDGHPGIWGDENVLGVIPDWDNRYAHEELFTNILVFKDDDRVVDEHQVVYTKDGKHLLNCLNTFDEKEYRVRDGVTTICDDAFFWRKNAGQKMTLYIPRSVKYIGDNIFGDGTSVLGSEGQGGGRIIIID